MSHEINYPHTCNVFFFLIQNEKKEERHPIRQTVDCKPDIIYRFILFAIIRDGSYNRVLRSFFEQGEHTGRQAMIAHYYIITLNNRHKMIVFNIFGHIPVNNPTWSKQHFIMCFIMPPCHLHLNVPLVIRCTPEGAVHLQPTA